MSKMGELFLRRQEALGYGNDGDYDPKEWPSDEEILAASEAYLTKTSRAEEEAAMAEYCKLFPENMTDEELAAQAHFYEQEMLLRRRSEIEERQLALPFDEVA